jgi:hypothetical protein
MLNKLVSEAGLLSKCSFLGAVVGETKFITIIAIVLPKSDLDVQQTGLSSDASLLNIRRLLAAAVGATKFITIIAKDLVTLFSAT